jgi:hypothetical protein
LYKVNRAWVKVSVVERNEENPMNRECCHP